MGYAWIERVRELVADTDRVRDGVQGTRDALLGLWIAIRSAPDAVKDLYRGFDEASLSAKADALDLDAPMTIGDATDRAALEGLLFGLATRLRATENALLALSDGAPPKRSADVLARHAGETAYVVPRKKRNRACKTREPFARRGLARMRMLPSRIPDAEGGGSTRVDLVFADDPQGRLRLKDGTAPRVGTSLFRDLRMVSEPVGDGFAVTEVHCPGQLARMMAQVASASDGRCMGIVYPELSVPQSVLSGLAEHLRELPPGEADFSFVLAGSLHRRGEDGRMRNVATMLDARGDVLAEHAKLYRYSDGAGPHEAIELGESVTVVVFEDAIVAIAICLDFCNRSQDPPFLRLDVDYVLVPSCGDAKTIGEHLRRSADVLTKLNVRTVVVQQTDAAPPQDVLGYVLVRTTRDDPEPASLERREEWLIVAL